MTSRPPRLLALDVNDTLSDLDALAPRFEEVGAPAQLLKTWFASVLRDGFALTAAGVLAWPPPGSTGVARPIPTTSQSLT